ncbi:endopeptidase [Corynebacterium poyangense]|uniref:Endopeptidase n=1 Tax=Corynebacterium poyangense TaxID=2684405 RepID=A0A7H0SPV3_9CORY|nr:C40 family peptidase [Corynebacterium poyangense]MBZ8178171.1 endopeptidase [Corynebacterium poyangense]QNQ90578.1 endopeptidase [Corynebacterium poyangense]
MAKHRRQNLNNTRRVAAASALAVGATVLANPAAHAADITIPGTGLNFQADVENIPGVANVPGVEQFVPALQGQAAPVDIQGAIANAASQTSSGNAIVDAARSKIGAPYAWGAAGPDAFDCSGLVYWAHQQVGKHIPRTSQAQAAAGTPVPLSDLQPGDVVAFYGGASHVGIYVGNNTIIDALQSGTPVGERPLNYMPIHSAVRF